MVLVDLQGPLKSNQDWNTCWSVYAHSRLYSLLSHALHFLGEIAKGRIFPFPFMGTTYQFAIVSVEEEADQGVTVRSVCPESEKSTSSDMLDNLPKAPICLVHGLPYEWTPKNVPAWHALDLFANACTDDCLTNIFYNLKKSNVESLVVWGLDCMQSSDINRVIRAADGLVRIVLVASELHLVEPKLLELIKPDHIVSRRTETAAKAKEKTLQYPIPDISGIPHTAIELADMYFITPIAYPDLVSSFAGAIPTLASPKILICGPARSGKTTLANWIIAKSVAANPAITVFQTRSSSLFSKYLGSSEKRVMKLFKRAEAAAPSILLIEGIHTLCPSRLRDDDNDGETGVEDTYNRMVATFLTCLDGLDTRDRKIAVIGTSLVEPEKLDPAAIRPGRLELHITLPPIVD